MRQIITSARYARHLDAHSFATFAGNERLSDAHRDEDAPPCECCGGTDLVRECEVAFVDHDPMGEFIDTISYDLCRDCAALPSEVMRERAREYQCQCAYQVRMFRVDALRRFAELRAGHAQDVDWAVIVKAMRERGIEVELCWG